MKYTILGSCSTFEYPDDIPKFYNGVNLLDPRNGELMEMDSYHLFLFFHFSGFSNYERKIVEAVINNLDEGTGFWSHKMWTEKEVHLRFTSSALRTLILASYYKVIINDQEIIKLFDKHLEFQDKIQGQIWYLHDSLEQEKKYHARNLRLKKWKSKINNMFVLNTHIDTINTLLVLSGSTSRFGSYNDAIKQSISFLEEVVFATNNLPKWAHHLDYNIREIVFGTGNRSTILDWIKKQIILKGYFSIIRLRIRNLYPTYFFRDGYIERDLCLSGKSFEYHVVNLWDIAKFCWLTRERDDLDIENLTSFFKEKLILGINYIINSNYKNYIAEAVQNGKNGFIEICEVIIILIQLDIVQDSFFSLYIFIRELFPPSIALKFYDPMIIFDYDEFTLKYSNDRFIDLIKISNTDYFISNIDTKVRTIEIGNETINVEKETSFVYSR